MKRLILFLSVLVIIIGCQTDYQKMKQRELASGVRQDSLFLGLKFGMTKREFFAHCWELNAQKLVIHGGKNQTVEYNLKELEHPAKMNFYPNFHEGKIYEMPVSFTYTGWSPWNKHLSSDSLLIDVVDLMENWYDPGFLRLEHPKKGIAYTKVDGNRRIILFAENERVVKAIITDLVIDEQLKKEQQKGGL